MLLLIRRLTFSPGFKLTPDIFTITVSLLANRGSEKGRDENINSAFNLFIFCPLSLPFADLECGAIRIQSASAQTPAQTYVWAFLSALKGFDKESRWRWDFQSDDWHISGTSETRLSWKQMKYDIYVNTKKKVICQAIFTVYCFEFDGHSLSILKQRQYSLTV